MQGAVAVIGCTKAKRSLRSTAIEMYDRSRLFRNCVAAARSANLPILIVSTKFGVLRPNDLVEPYERDLAVMTPASRATWSAMVSSQFEAAAAEGGFTRVVLLAGRELRQPVEAACARMKLACEIHPGWEAIVDEMLGKGAPGEASPWG